jgi:pyruvate/2-oxoglutarate dehydrogenase complex dihydrolipoamide acyltransferase (E2) component
MSKRKGDYITVQALINEVGKDASRFIMLNRSSDAELDFDFTKVKEKSKDNPLYYVQYCYARISSVFRLIGKNINNEIVIKNNHINNLKTHSENYEEQDYKKENWIHASPIVRRLAREFGINLKEIKSSGRKNRITKQDIQNYVKTIIQKPEPQIDVSCV